MLQNVFECNGMLQNVFECNGMLSNDFELITLLRYFYFNNFLNEKRVNVWNGKGKWFWTITYKVVFYF